MKIVAINGTPRKGKISKTNRILDAFLDGCREAGAEIEIVKLREKDIKPCTGCYCCWTKTPGQCALKDDMADILTITEGADLEVWATPLYFWGPTGLFKNYLDRTIPLSHPFFIEKGGLLTHPHRRDKVADKVIISVCGMPELKQFDVFSQWLHFLEGRGLGRIVAEIYRASAEFLTAPPFAAQLEEVLSATTKAGREVVQTGTVSSATMQIIQQELIDKATFIEEGNKYFHWEQKRWEQK